VIGIVPEIVGHRGAAGLAPENTVPAFRLAYELGVRILELDVRVTADGIPMVMHDASVHRTTNGTGRVREMSLDEIRALDAGRRFGISAHIPSLMEALASLPADTRWFIELKRDETAPEAVVAAVLRDLDAVGGSDRCRLISFDEALLVAARGQAPSLRLGVLTARDLDAPMRIAQSLGCEAVMPELGMMSEETVASCHAAGFRVTAWTANIAEQMRELARLGVDEITTDYPDLALRTLSPQHRDGEG